MGGVMGSDKNTETWDKLGIWNNLSKPPADALKTIQAGRLKGMTDINPQWRYKAMTEAFGPCGEGWRFEIVDRWIDSVSDQQSFAMVQINLFFLIEGEWSEPIPGIGGSRLINKEKSGLYASDEAFKMALTDALSVAMKMIGVGAKVYMGQWDTKNQRYNDEPPEMLTEKQIKQIVDLIEKKNIDRSMFLEYMGVESCADIPSDRFNKAMSALNKAKGQDDKKA